MGKLNEPKKYSYSTESLDKIIFVGGGQSPLKGVSGAEACAVMGYHGQLQHIMKVELDNAKHNLVVQKKLKKQFPSPDLDKEIEETQKRIQFAREIIGECDKAALYEMFSMYHNTDEAIWARVNDTIKIHYQDRQEGSLTPKEDTDKFHSLHKKNDEKTK